MSGRPDPSWFRCRYCHERTAMAQGDLERCVVRQNYTSPDNYEGACSECRQNRHPDPDHQRCQFCQRWFLTTDPDALSRDPAASIREYRGSFEYHGVCEDCAGERRRLKAQLQARGEVGRTRLHQVELNLRDLCDRSRARPGATRWSNEGTAREVIEVMDEVLTAALFPDFHHWSHRHWPCGEVVDLVAEGHLELVDGAVGRLRRFERDRGAAAA